MKSTFFVCATVLAGAAGSVLATPINYGDFAGVSVDWLQVTEDSATDPTPLFGTPTISGDSLNFNPVSFGSTASNGSSDLTDGTLTSMIAARPGFTIPAIQFNESGDYTLAGVGGAGTSASVNLAVFVWVLEVNNTAITPVSFAVNGTFNPSSGTFDLANDGPTFGIRTWNGGAMADINAFLASQNIAGGATKVTVTIDNSLVTTSQAGTLAFIKKKQIGGVAITVVPTPGAAALMGLGALVATRRRR
ncbi:MAG: hypothetical protein U0637_12460 [Phycisphaerales bacterium]